MRNNQIKDLLGKEFGLLKVIGFSHVDEKKQAYWKCICKCTPEKVITKKGRYLLAGDTKSCGCLKREHLKEARKKSTQRNKKEQYSKPFYKELKNNWNTMLNRCHNKNYKGFKNYGAKGIYVCDEWRFNFWNFYSFSIENGYQKGYTLDRLGNNYSPDSCEWVAKKVNCGWTKNITQISIRGITKSASDWEKDAESEVSASTILNRYKDGVRGTKLIKKRVKLKDKIIEIDGQIKSFSEWAEYAEISLNAFKTRWRRGNRGKNLIRPSRAKQAS